MDLDAVAGAAQPAARARGAAAVAGAGAAVQRLRAAVTVLLLALVALGLAWELKLAPTGSGTLAIKVLPLVAALPGVLRHRLYTYRWLALLIWLYVLEGLVRAGSEHGIAAALAMVEVALGITLFAAAAAYIRRRLRGSTGSTGSAGSAVTPAVTPPADTPSCADTGVHCDAGPT